MANLLVVDDSKVMREMVIACLRGQGGMVFNQASSGLEAIEKLSIHPTDLVVLDLNMPDINGYEVIKFVRGQQGLVGLPIIVLTTRGDESSKEQALSAGATAFMTKPFTPEGISSEVRRLLTSQGGEQGARHDSPQ